MLTGATNEGWMVTNCIYISTGLQIDSVSDNVGTRRWWKIRLWVPTKQLPTFGLLCQKI